jgi:hypothetical protein
MKKKTIKSISLSKIKNALAWKIEIHTRDKINPNNLLLLSSQQKNNDRSTNPKLSFKHKL